MSNQRPTKIEGLFLVLDRRNDKGLEHWCEDLEKRGIPAVISVDEYTLDNNNSLVKKIADKGFEVMLGYNGGPFWNTTYDFQYEIMNRMKNKVELCTKKPMRVFHSKYMAYNEETLKVSDEIGIDYILGRGTAKARAVVYKPEEYKCKIISVSNVPSKTMGTGSLCDESLRCRTETPDTLKELLLNFKEDRMLLVAQTHVSGVKLQWWNVYQDFFDANMLTWKTLDEFCARPIVMPNAKIPINTEADYVIPKPKMPLEQEQDFPFKG